jgi:hypothetical protein
MATSSSPLNTFEKFLPGLKTYIIGLVTIGYGVYQWVHTQHWETATVPALIGSLSLTLRAALEEFKALVVPKL